MTTKSALFLEIWREARSRFSNQLPNITSEDLTKKLPPSQNSIGFLIRHIGDVELLFVKNIFGSSIKVSAKTIIAQHDTGEWIHLEELMDYVSYSGQKLAEVITEQTDEDWEQLITTKEFGTKTKAEALGRIISHTAYHAGQMAVIKKYAIH